ncbi:MAG TPA: disulfide bond formation protein B [Noviherbaspirillum sp.]|uniref:disulfide bond formation protein B n=1 Tax=Noviherbaspirillum sp. TaxID=1926288 RepID=UPI002D36BB65|nr:disulfide bond formation protein B [Noviherbaspirillum sp.]HYD95938.1 disulfide bond formation protein B [Noviherbaspirillum sp.]
MGNDSTMAGMRGIGAGAGQGGAAWTCAFAAWLVAALSVLGALFLGEVMGYAPCVLCWYQRIFMFPLVFVLAAGLFPLDPRLVRYALPLAAAGWLVALFHTLLVAGIVPERASPCSQGVPCSQVQLELFGFLTIPLMSLAAFSVINILLIATYLKTRQ